MMPATDLADLADRRLRLARCAALVAALSLAAAPGGAQRDLAIADFFALPELSSPQVSRPAHVRYAFASNPQATLYNQEGLPAVPFRTDREKK